jgi:hypothetical protein
VIVLHVGCVHQEGEQEGPRVGGHWRLAASNPARAAAYCDGARAANDAGRGNGIASDGLAGALHQLAIDPPPDASIATVVEVKLDRRAWRKVPGQRTSLAAGRPHHSQWLPAQATVKI